MQRSSGRYVIYYGWLIADAAGTPGPAATAIAAAGPGVLIGFYYTFEPKYPNFSRQVRDLLRAAQISFFAYVDTDYGNRPLAAVEAEARDYLAKGVDGIFFDQAYNFLDDRQTPYYQQLYALVHSSQKSVIINTGVAQSGEAIMEVTDILMVEHDWRLLPQLSPWHGRYPPTRFMGNSSNEAGTERYFDYRIGYEAAVRDTHEAWASGIGWHYSTDHYTTLPAWFSDYARSVSTPIDIPPMRGRKRAL
ncbi:MAG: spherulation-specific family 4 protein [Chloroflexales bacterium]